jgi:hypothetical protein
MSGTSPVVVFDYAAWLLRFPEFAAVDPGQVQRFFDEATILLDNTACSPVCDVTIRTILLNLLTAHIGVLNGALSPTGAVAPGSGGGMVGRIESANEGSVSVTAGYDQSGDGPGASWYLQSSYGATYWAMTARYRTWQYYVGPQPFIETGPPYGNNPQWPGYKRF